MRRRFGAVLAVLFVLGTLLGLGRTGFAGPGLTATLVSETGRTGNPRFGFHFDFPAAWERVDPANGDGSRFLHPFDHRIQYSCWGSHDVFQESPRILQKKWLNGLPEAELIEERYSGPFAVAYQSSAGGGPLARKIEGWRFVYRHREQGVPMKSIQVLIPSDTRMIGALATAPAELFPLYEEFFLQLLSRIVITDRL